MQQQSTDTRPPMLPGDEATEQQLQLARKQGEALRGALDHMVNREAHDGGTQRAGDYLIAYAVEEAEGLYELRNGKLEWVEPGDQNVHVEVAVCDAADGRFIPGLTVHATLTAADGQEVGRHQQHFLWHPWLYHYGRNWTVPNDGQYQLRVQIDPPTFMRHDRKNGKRYADPIDVTFDNVKIKTGQK